MRVLNLGCGGVKREFPEVGVASQIVGVDFFATDDIDVVHDLNRYPYPLGDSSFDLIILQDVIEHLKDIPTTLAEVHRIGVDGAQVRIRTPQYSSYYAFSDPTHKHYLSSLAFDSFLVPNRSIYAPSARFRLQRRKLLFPRVWRLLGISTIANRYPTRWEQLFAFLFRAENMEFSLIVTKE